VPIGFSPERAPHTHNQLFSVALPTALEGALRVHAGWSKVPALAWVDQADRTRAAPIGSAEEHE
jgi:hypothetical protein